MPEAVKAVSFWPCAGSSVLRVALTMYDDVTELIQKESENTILFDAPKTKCNSFNQQGMIFQVWDMIMSKGRNYCGICIPGHKKNLVRYRH